MFLVCTFSWSWYNIPDTQSLHHIPNHKLFLKWVGNGNVGKNKCCSGLNLRPWYCRNVVREPTGVCSRNMFYLAKPWSLSGHTTYFLTKNLKITLLPSDIKHYGLGNFAWWKFETRPSALINMEDGKKRSAVDWKQAFPFCHSVLRLKSVLFLQSQLLIMEHILTVIIC